MSEAKRRKLQTSLLIWLSQATMPKPCVSFGSNIFTRDSAKIFFLPVQCPESCQPLGLITVYFTNTNYNVHLYKNYMYIQIGERMTTTSNHFTYLMNSNDQAKQTTFDQNLKIRHSLSNDNQILQPRTRLSIMKYFLSASNTEL